MKKILKLLFFPLFLLSLSACGTEIDNRIYEAADALDNTDYEDAQNICDRTINRYWDEMTLENKCDLAAIYAVLYSEMDGDENDKHNIGMLKKCYSSAMDEDSKATREYLNSLEDGAHDAIELVIEMTDWANELEDLGDDLEDLGY